MSYEIEDTEIRIIGAGSPIKPKRKVLIGSVVVGLCIVAIIGLLILLCGGDKPSPTVFEPEQVASQPHPLREWVTALDTATVQATAVKDTVVNDVPLRIYAPLNCTPRLEVGYQCIENREQNILLFQAADVRADNKKIVGAFVLRGEPLSYGLSKRGYCAIIDGEVQVGVADNSPLFEAATETGGYFFRQYPLVDNGELVENELKSKSIRRGLCELEGRIVVVETETTESLHDFSQALVDIGVSNAVYLVGSSAIGWIRDTDGNGIKRGLWDERIYKNVNFIVWSK